jgi:hypothetical protein
MRFRNALAVASLALAIAAPLRAQFPRDVAVGSRVRVTIGDQYRQGPLAPRQQWIAGTVTQLGGDTLYLRAPGTSGALAVPRASMRRLEVSRGAPSRGASAVGGAVGGAFIGAAWAIALRQIGWGELQPRSLGYAAGRGAAWGAGVGVVLGALSPSEQWRHVRLR